MGYSMNHQTGESIREFAAFLVYANAVEQSDPGSSINMAYVAHASGVKVEDVHRWAGEHAWQERVGAEMHRRSLTLRQEKPARSFLADQPSIHAFVQVLDARAAQRQMLSAEHDREHTDGDWLALFVARIGKFSMAYLNGHVDLKQKRAAQLGALCLAYLESRE